MGEQTDESAPAEDRRRRGPSFRRPSRRVAVIAGIVALVIAGGLVALLAGGENEACCAPPPEESTRGDSEPERGEDPAGVRPVEGLDLDEQVDQVLLAGFEGESVDDDVIDQVGEHQLGGVLIGSGNWESASAGRKVVDGLLDVSRDAGEIPPLIATSQEGGDSRTLPDLPPAETQTQIADEGSPDAVVEWSRSGATALADAGLTLDLFPVADVATLDSPLGDRVFSDSPSLVGELTVDALEGCEEAELACAPAHFPGLGGVAGDTDSAPAGVSLDEATLRARDLRPFEAAVEADAPALVVSLAFYSAIDGTTPAVFSPAVTTDLLRRDLGFRGAAITDDLDAGAIRGSYEPGEAAVRALEAGADLLQFSDPESVEEAREAITAAVEDGSLEPGRLAEAVERVLELKRDAGLIEDESGGSGRGDSRSGGGEDSGEDGGSSGSGGSAPSGGASGEDGSDSGGGSGSGGSGSGSGGSNTP